MVTRHFGIGYEADKAHRLLTHKGRTLAGLGGEVG